MTFVIGVSLKISLTLNRPAQLVVSGDFLPNCRLIYTA